MKHVFFIHSHITWLVSLGVIRKRELDCQGVLFVCSRGYEPPDTEFERIKFPDRGWLLTWRPGKWIHDRRELAHFVDSVAQNTDFQWYLPHTGFLFFRAFVRHPHCRGFHLIEEGIGSYYTRDALNTSIQRAPVSMPGWKGWLQRQLSSIRPPELADTRYLFAYGCTDEAFPGYARRIKVDLVEKIQPGDEDIETVLVLDNLMEVGLVDENTFFRCLDELIAKLAKEGRRTVYYKPHPGQYVDPRYMPRLRKVLQGNTYGVDFRELPASYCLELLASTGRPDFYIFISSVGYYAAVSGCLVYSMASRLAAIDARYKVIKEIIPEVMSRRVTFL